MTLYNDCVLPVIKIQYDDPYVLIDAMNIISKELRKNVPNYQTIVYVEYSCKYIKLYTCISIVLYCILICHIMET